MRAAGGDLVEPSPPSSDHPFFWGSRLTRPFAKPSIFFSDFLGDFWPTDDVANTYVLHDRLPYQRK
ncbi:MAG: hypothetical protein EBX30_12190, partial [Betaproteobacteria bacterium]|nr:hypothetical protein [Betaproteobacteria bacterium]